jgi:hypothetical protein
MTTTKYFIGLSGDGDKSDEKISAPSSRSRLAACEVDPVGFGIALGIAVRGAEND